MRVGGTNVSWAPLLDAVGAVAFVVACAAITWSVLSRPGAAAPPTPAEHPAAPSDAPLPADPLSLAGAVVQGSATAGVAVIEYSEFQCPYCGRFATDSLPLLRRKYVDSGKVLWAFRHFPLEQIHSNAVGAAVAAECAAEQGRFDQMHDELFAHQGELDAEHLETYAQRAGLNLGQYSVCLTGTAEARVRADMNGGQSLGVQGTPTFFLGRVQQDGTVKVTKRLFGALPVAAFERELEALLSASPPTW